MAVLRGTYSPPFKPNWKPYQPIRVENHAPLLHEAVSLASSLVAQLKPVLNQPQTRNAC